MFDVDKSLDMFVTIDKGVLDGFDMSCTHLIGSLVKN